MLTKKRKRFSHTNEHVTPIRDPLSPKERSIQMGRVKSTRNISTEMRVLTALRRMRVVGWRRHVANVPGSPDFFFRKENLALFVHGCFWHGCRTCGRIPKTNVSFWSGKIAANKLRDRRVRRRLKGMGIRCMTVWEHELQRGSWIKRVMDALSLAKTLKV